MTKKEGLVEEAKGLGIDTTGLTTPQLQQAIADAPVETPVEDVADVEVVAEEVVAPEPVLEKEEVPVEKTGCACKIDVAPLLSEKSLQAIANCANGMVDSKDKLEAIVRSCIVG